MEQFHGFFSHNFYSRKALAGINHFRLSAISIMPFEKDLLLRDTENKNITQDNTRSYGKNPQSDFLCDISIDTVPEN